MRWNKRKNIILYQNENGKLLEESLKLENELKTVKREKRLDDLIELDKNILIS
jgi:hypothetical protein